MSRYLMHYLMCIFRRANAERANSIQHNSFEELYAFQRALKEFVATIDATYAKVSREVFKYGN